MEGYHGVAPAIYHVPCTTEAPARRARPPAPTDDRLTHGEMP